MAITTLLLGGVCFAAGIYAGMFLAEEDFLHTKDVKALASELNKVASEIFSEPVRYEPRKPRVVSNHDGTMVVRY